MKPFKEALKTVIESAPAPVEHRVPLSESRGYVLSRNIVSDIDMPPFDRSAMDGFAVAGEGLRHDLQDEITAGRALEIKVSPGHACPIMTGAPVPEGADRIAIVEEAVVEDSVLLLSRPPKKGAHICWQGEDIRKGQTVLEHGTRLSPQHLGIAAMAGRTVLPVFDRPRISVVTTGTEVIPPEWIPSPGMVRNANLPLIISQLEFSGFHVTASAHAADDVPSLKAAFGQMLSCTDVLVTAGGVSKGTRDYVPSVLESLGVDLHFRRVAQKPGKPFTFGTGEGGRAVFGLPGNPVSVMVSLEEFLLPYLRKRSGFKGFHKRTYHGTLTSDYSKKPGRLHFLRVLAYREGDRWMLHLPETSGSGDLMSTVNTNALAMVDADTVSVRSGDGLPFHFMASTAGELSFA